MGQTITEKILARAAGRGKVSPGEYIWADIDGLMMHDVTSTGEINILKKNFNYELAAAFLPPNSSKIVVVPDHYVPKTSLLRLYTKN